MMMDDLVTFDDCCVMMMTMNMVIWVCAENPPPTTGEGKQCMYCVYIPLQSQRGKGSFEIHLHSKGRSRTEHARSILGFYSSMDCSNMFFRKMDLPALDLKTQEITFV